MIFEFRCFKCNHVNSWVMDPINISEYECKECHEPIGCSNGKEIKFYNKDKISYGDSTRYRIYSEPTYGFYTGYTTSTIWLLY